ncbi:MAG: Lrp/AsnC ligand binding domain-containing protein [Rhodobiaceae bacterium]|nr:Lrp/AsnC ligand binding domain-containing protein [Rhodobiaceae bacterium]MCC0017222.1 Lrp/AsnC ligand binding domain-containing protein [Rhodobiaceae bacterium]MCC0041785.1 Lrp/AsnC ligand binding domain-containing protein [Rhodobiaceae bacterium]MCC0052501.1 Lrp/AsnC ligand binding domain-containing protein [Rhodobiaceae bacterium]
MADTTEEIDATDLAILSALQSDARITLTELAKAVNLSPTPCAVRMRRLERDGYIRGYHARLDPVRLGRGMLVYVQVTLHNSDEATLAAFNAAISKMPEALECHMVGGGFDYLIKLRVRDMKDYRAILGGAIGALPAVAATHSYFVMEEVKSTSLLPLPRARRTSSNA